MSTNLDTNKAVKAAENYIDVILSINDLGLTGIGSMYGLDSFRMEHHKELCDIIEIDRNSTKDICSRLDKHIGLKFGEEVSDRKLNDYAKKLVQKLIELKHTEGLY